MRSKYLIGAAFATLLLQAPAAMSATSELATAVVQTTSTGSNTGFDGVVEAVRQTVIAAQVAGAIVAVNVRAGDTVKAGQVLLRIDARAAEQNSASSEAQVQVARSQLEVASRELERQRQLFQKQYISRAALERAEAQYRATSAQVSSQLAQAGAARTQSGFFIVKAPYAGIVAELPVTLGDMAMPGRPLLTLYDPSALRVTVAVPQSAAARLQADQPLKLELPGLSLTEQQLTPLRVQVLPTTDAGTHTTQVRLDLQPALKGAAPGMFARVWLPIQSDAAGRLFVPARAIVRRAEMTGLYVIDPQGRPLLRQVRVGRVVNDTIEVLSGVAAGERVALDPQAAVRIR